eukprot:3990492-Ditylum_brightwellii.AAC.2
MDDRLMFAHKEKDVDDIIAYMIDNGFSLYVEDVAAGFLGIELDCQHDNMIELKQLALIQCTINAVGFQLSYGKATPFEIAELSADVDGLGPQEIWSYSSIVGMLIYLSGTIRPKIAMVVHQCA